MIKKKLVSEAAGMVRNIQMRIWSNGGMQTRLAKNQVFSSESVGSNPTLTTINKIKVGNIMNLKKQLIENRISLLRSRDPVSNANIIRKLERRLRDMK